ncbi:hypothetical protein V8V91_21035 [Algoriphagus halophilus]
MPVIQALEELGSQTPCHWLLAVPLPASQKKAIYGTIKRSTGSILPWD